MRPTTRMGAQEDNIEKLRRPRGICDDGVPVVGTEGYTADGLISCCHTIH